MREIAQYMRLEVTERMVLSSANEDYFGLYEIIWELNSTFPQEGLGEKYAAAEAAVRSLLARGWIQLYRRKGGFNRDSPTYEPVELDTIEEVLSNPVSWYPEYANERIECTATEDGERAYYAGALQPTA